MTPQEAVDKLPSTRRIWRLALLESVASTATKNETRRCEGVARMLDNEYARQYRTEMFADATHVPSGKHLCDMIADAILTTGGLKVDE